MSLELKISAGKFSLLHDFIFI